MDRLDFYSGKHCDNPHDIIKDIPKEYLPKILHYVMLKCLEQKYLCIDGFKLYNDDPEYLKINETILQAPEPFMEIKRKEDWGNPNSPLRFRVSLPSS